MTAYAAETSAIAASDPRWSRTKQPGECPRCESLHPWVAPDKTRTCPACWRWADDPGAPSVPMADPAPPERVSRDSPASRWRGAVVPANWTKVRAGLYVYREGRTVCVPIDVASGDDSCTLCLTREDALVMLTALNRYLKEIPASKPGFTTSAKT